MSIRILVVDDQQLLREGIQILLDAEPDLEVVGLASDGVHAVEQAQKLSPDVVLMDIRMPRLDGVSATRELAAVVPEARVIILTTFDDDEYVFEGLKAGAHGYLLKDISSEEMAAAVRTVAAGGALMEPRITRKVVAEFSRLSESQPKLPEPLTEREKEVLRALAQGCSNREIASQFHITEGTVKNHVSNLLGKLQASDRTQAVLKAQQLRLV